MSASDRGRLSYAAVLRLPYARRTFAAALLGRLSYGMLALSVMLTVTRATGSYAVAGTITALFGATGVILAPVRAALVDRHGPRLALLPMALLYAGLLGALAAASWQPGAPVLPLGTIAAAAGAAMPPLGPSMRAVWCELTGEPALLQRAYSLDGVAEEVLLVSGPLLVGALVQIAPPAAGIVVSALLVGGGTLAFVMSPAVRDVRPAAAAAEAEGTAHSGARVRGTRALLTPVVVAAGVGLSLGAMDLLVLAFVTAHQHGDDMAAWVLAALSAGSTLGGLLNGAVSWQAGARVRLPRLAVGLGLALAAAGLAPGVGTLTVAVACAGFFVAPALTTAYLLADEAAPRERRTRAGAWVNTAVNAGISGGTATAGLLAARLPLGVCFAFSGGVTVLAAMACAVRKPEAAGPPLGEGCPGSQESAQGEESPALSPQPRRPCSAEGVPRSSPGSRTGNRR
ncbi:MFS transporter [Streptomyces qinglanensis]|uniref:MFS transporter n=1 Tax=Streptomyces qinglanensis TaxID=943816 RepID=UPI00085CDAF9|nr:MFS transporter [Streptomyces qinglanensis]